MVFHQIGGTPFPLGVNGHLHIAQIGNGIERRTLERINPGDDRKKCEDKHEEAIPHTCCDDALDHLAVLAFGRWQFEIVQRALHFRFGIDEEVRACDNALTFSQAALHFVVVADLLA